MHRILVDNNGLVNVLYKQVLDKMEIKNLAVKLVNTSFLGFLGSLIMPVGEVIPPSSKGELPVRVTEMTKFLVVDHPSAYNAIIRRPAIHNFRAVPSSYHVVMKFPTRWGVGSAKGNQAESWRTYATIT